MAANEERASLWRTPLSTPLRTNENGVQDLFKHSEKLLASAVSICRLKGSVECQTGGIITVCEELQRLLRLSFSENARIEKEIKKQKLHYDEEISMLKERINCLEEEKELIMKKHFKDGPRGATSQSVTMYKETVQNPQVMVNKLKITENKPKEIAMGQESKGDETSKENIKPGKENESKVNENIPMEANSEDIDNASLEISYLESPKASKVKTKGQKKDFKKVGKKALSSKKKKHEEVTEVLVNVKQDDAEYIAESDVSGKSRRSSRKSSKDDIEKVESIMESPADDIREMLTTSVHLNPDTGLLETVEVDEEQAEQVKEKPRKNTKKKDTQKNKKDEKNSKNSSKVKTGKVKKSLDDDNVGDHPLGQKEKGGDFPGSGPGIMVSEGNVNAQKTPDNKEKETTSKIAKPKTPGKTPEQEEELGDVGFLIDISSMITTFVSNPDTTDLELPLMSARERADARKLAALFDLHISIGSKMDNRSSLNLTKTPNSKMPKPGKLDNLLSKLSIAAAREAEKASAKTRTKRKLSSVTDVDGSCNGEESTWDDSQPKKSSKNLSRSKKARM